MVDRTLLGRRTDGSYGLDISLPGFDVKTALPHQMAFSSNWSGGAVIHQTGILTEHKGKTVFFPQLPYIPFVYLVLRDTVNDDPRSSVQYIQPNYNDLRWMFHPFCRVYDNRLFFDDSQYGRVPSVTNYDVRYAVFRTRGI